MTDGNTETNSSSDRFVLSREQVQTLESNFPDATRKQRISIIMLLADSTVHLTRQLGYPLLSILGFLIQQGYGYFESVEMIGNDDIHHALQELTEDEIGDHDLYTRISNLLEETESVLNRRELNKIEDLKERISDDELFDARELDRGKDFLTYQLDRILGQRSTDLERVFEHGYEGEEERLLELKNVHSELLSRYLHDRFRETRRQYQHSPLRWENGREGIRQWITDMTQLAIRELGMEQLGRIVIFEHIGNHLTRRPVGTLLRKLRKTAGFSQKKTVEKTGVCSRQYLSEIETGEAGSPSYQIVRKLGRVLSDALSRREIDSLSSSGRSFVDCCGALPARERLSDLLDQDHIAYSTFARLIQISRWILNMPDVFLTDVLLLNETFHAQDSADQGPDVLPGALAFLGGLHKRNRNRLFPESLDLSAKTGRKMDLEVCHRAGYLYGRMLLMDESYPSNASGLQQISTFEDTEEIKHLLSRLDDWGFLEIIDRDHDRFRNGQYKIISTINSVILSSAGLDSPFISGH